MQLPRSTPPTSQESPSELEWVVNLLRIFWRRRWLVLISMTLGLAGGSAYLQTSTSMFEAHAHLSVTQANSPDIDVSRGSTEQNEGQRFVEQEMVRLKSDALLIRSLYQLQKTLVYAQDFKSWTVVQLRKSLTVAVEPTGNVSITTHARTAELATAVVDSMVQAYVQEHESEHFETADLTIQHLKNLQDRQTKELQSHLDQIAQLDRDYGELLSTRSGASLATQNMTVLSDALAKARVETLQCRLAMELIANVSKNPDSMTDAVLDQSGQNLLPEGANRLMQLVDQRSQLLAQRSDLIGRLGPAHPDVVAINHRLDLIDTSITTVAGAIGGETVRRYETAMQREQAALKSYQQYDQKIAALSSVTVQYQRENAEAQHLQDLLKDLRGRIDRLTSWREVCPPAVTMLDPGQPDVVEIKANVQQAAQASFGGAIVLGIILILLFEIADRRLWTLRDVAGAVRLPAWGGIPATPGQQSFNASAQTVSLSPGSLTAEAYRQVAATLLHRASVANAKTILLASTRRGEGRTTLCTNLAIACAQTARRVLLIDADCRNPTIENIFKVDFSHGLSGILLSGCDPTSVVRPTEIENLSILPCGALSAHGAGLLNGPVFRDALATLKRDYDVILIDSASLEHASDASLISAVADLSLLVVGLRMTKPNLAKKSKSRLISAGARLNGVIVNLAKNREDLHADVSHPHLLAPAVGETEPHAMRIAG